MVSNPLTQNTSTVRRLNAFTIIELLIVIVIISIIAGISLVAYTSTTQRAVVSSIQADLTNAKKALLSFQTTSPTNSFPTAINCTNPTSTEICLRPTGSNTYTYNVNNTSSPKTFNLTSTNGTTKYWINNGSTILSQIDIVTDGLIVNFDLGDPTSYPGFGNTVYDLSGNNLNGTLMNGVGYDSSSGGSLVFDRINDYVITPSTTIASSQTLTAWAVATGTPDSPAGIIAQHDHASTANFGINYVTGYRLAPSIGYTDGTREYSSKQTNYIISPNTVFYVALVYDSNLNKIYWYINGALDSTYTLTKTPKFTNWPICLGRWNPNYNAYYFSGRIYYGSIYSRALTVAEIQQNFNTMRGRYGI